MDYGWGGEGVVVRVVYLRQTDSEASMESCTSLGGVNHVGSGAEAELDKVSDNISTYLWRSPECTCCRHDMMQVPHVVIVVAGWMGSFAGAVQGYRVYLEWSGCFRAYFRALGCISAMR